MENEILNLINNSQNILLITHPNPDGDTLGSASALKCMIKKLGKNADILLQIEDNFRFPNTYSFLPHLNSALNLSTFNPDSYDLMIALDTASFDRLLEPIRTVFKNAKNTVVIDHHKTNKGYAQINYIRGGISSTGEVLYDLMKKINIEITTDIAVGLYAAILTDTGCFKYESTTSHTFEIASELSKIIDISKIADLCYTNKPKNLVLFQSEILSKANFVFNNKVAYALITGDIIEKYQAKDDYTEGICETLRSISGVEAAFVLKEIKINDKPATKVSIRTCETDATKISDKFQGGGHKRAAGCTIKLSINQALEKILSVVREYL